MTAAVEKRLCLRLCISCLCCALCFQPFINLLFLPLGFQLLSCISASACVVKLHKHVRKWCAASRCVLSHPWKHAGHISIWQHNAIWLWLTWHLYYIIITSHAVCTSDSAETCANVSSCLRFKCITARNPDFQLQHICAWLLRRVTELLMQYTRLNECLILFRLICHWIWIKYIPHT